MRMKRAITFFVCIAMLMTLLPTAALAADPVLIVGGVTMSASGYWKTDSSGVLTPSDSTDYTIHYNSNADHELTLNNATINGSGTAAPSGAAIYSREQNLTLILEGKNTVTAKSDVVTIGILIDTGHLTIKGAGTLNVNGGTPTAAYGNSTGISVISGSIHITENASVNATGNLAYVSSGICTTNGNITVSTLRPVTAAGKTYGINVSGTLTVSSGTVTAISSTQAMNKAPSTGSNVQYFASTDMSGTPTVSYVAGDIATYKYLQVYIPISTPYRPVTEITDVVGRVAKDVDVTLSAKVDPGFATYKTIAWSVSKAGTTGASITESGGVYTLCATATGTVTLTATIENGLEIGKPYTQNFDIEVVDSHAYTMDFTLTNAAWGGLSGVNLTTTDAQGTGWSWAYQSKTLTLNNLNFTTVADTAIMLPRGTTLVLNGTSTATSIYCGGGEDTNGINCNGDLAISGGGTLNAAGGVSPHENSRGALIGGSLTVNGGTLNLTGGNASSSFGAEIGESITMNGGTLTCTAGTGEDLDATGIKMGEWGPGTLTMNGGTLNAVAGTSENREVSSGVTIYGDIIMNDGVINAVGATYRALAYGIFMRDYGSTSSDIMISGGTLNAKGGSGALSRAPVTIENVTARASQNMSGCDPENYVSAQNGNYKWFRAATAGLLDLTVSVDASPALGGTVSGGGKYDEGTPVTVEAEANSGYRFVRWMADGKQISTSAVYTFAVAANETLTAMFESDNSANTLTIVPSIGETFTISYKAADSIENVKQYIQDAKGYSPEQQSLSHLGLTLEEGKTLRDYNICGGAALDLEIVSTASHIRIKGETLNSITPYYSNNGSVYLSEPDSWNAFFDVENSTLYLKNLSVQGDMDRLMEILNITTLYIVLDGENTITGMNIGGSFGISAAGVNLFIGGEASSRLTADVSMGDNRTGISAESITLQYPATLVVKGTQRATDRMVTLIESAYNSYGGSVADSTPTEVYSFNSVNIATEYKSILFTPKASAFFPIWVNGEQIDSTYMNTEGEQICGGTAIYTPAIGNKTAKLILNGISVISSYGKGDYRAGIYSEEPLHISFSDSNSVDFTITSVTSYISCGIYSKDTLTVEVEPGGLLSIDMYIPGGFSSTPYAAYAEGGITLVGGCAFISPDGAQISTNGKFISDSDGTTALKYATIGTAASFTDLTAVNGSDTEPTTILSLTFDKDIIELTSDDISVTGATKGELTKDSGVGAYSLTISDVTVADGGKN